VEKAPSAIIGSAQQQILVTVPIKIAQWAALVSFVISDLIRRQLPQLEVLCWSKPETMGVFVESVPQPSRNAKQMPRRSCTLRLDNQL
jgi:hypothetical protein